MREDLPTQQREEQATHERLSLTDLLCVRMAYERATTDICEHFIGKCRDSKDPVIRALDLSGLQQFSAALAEHINLLTQALDVLGDKATAPCQDEPFLTLLRGAQRQASEPGHAILASMQALLIVEQFNEVAWGLLLALMKDAELQRFVPHFEQACARHREQSTAIQQAYEDVALGLVRRNQVTMKSARPLRSTLVGRAGMLFGDPRHLGRA